ncbi:ribonuclease H-like domain-containing protein, partial [Phyllosticta citriasiana]
MKPVQHGSFESIKSATAKSPASDSASDESFGSSIFDGIDDLGIGSQSVDANSQDQVPSTSVLKPLADQVAVEVEEQAEVPYNLRFTIPSPPPPVNGVRSDPPLFWSHKLYRDAEGKSVTVHYCTNFEEAETLCKSFLNEKVVGFDMEWESQAQASSGIKKNISVIQVCSESKVAVFHVALFSGGDTTKELIPPSLISLIESENIIKTGVGIWSADGRRIQKFLNLNPRGFVELSHFFHVLQDMKTAEGKYPKKLTSLAKQVQAYLGLALPKGSVRTSSWSRKLYQIQVDYAAADAYAGLMLYHVMNEKRKKMRPKPPHPHFAELGLPI